VFKLVAWIQSHDHRGRKIETDRKKQAIRRVRRSAGADGARHRLDVKTVSFGVRPLPSADEGFLVLAKFCMGESAGGAVRTAGATDPELNRTQGAGHRCAMPKPAYIELAHDCRIPILYEDRAVLAIDKPPGWMLVPVSWQRTSWNLQAAIMSSMAAGHFWARSRNLKFLKYIHRLDAETSGILLFAKSQGALNTYSELFETRRMEKVYLAVTEKAPRQEHWTCRLNIAPHREQHGRMIAHASGKPAETEFQVIARHAGRHLIEARPYSGRQHQIRLHLSESGCPMLGDELYGGGRGELALRAVGLAYRDPFTRKPVTIRATTEAFLEQWGFHLEYTPHLDCAGSRDG
jgi:RluA family pseudouridine synthase